MTRSEFRSIHWSILVLISFSFSLEYLLYTSFDLSWDGGGSFGAFFISAFMLAYVMGAEGPSISVASFAALSASSFPATPACPGTHWIVS